MITTGIIKDINQSSSKYINNKYLVEISLFQKPGANNPDTYTLKANLATPSNMYGAYKIGDKVYVTFINGDLSLPLIIGKIYTGIDEKYRGESRLESLKVKNSAIFPDNTKFGNISVSDINKALIDINILKNNSVNIESISLETINEILEGN